MKDTLQLKHLAPYLPYGLRCINLHNKEVELMGLSNGNNSVSNEMWVFRENDQTGSYFQGYLYECKPLLHPMERIRTLGNENIPVNEHTINLLLIEKYGVDYGIFSYYKGEITIELDADPSLQYDQNKIISFNVFQTMQEELFKAHYDVFGLIPKGLAKEIEQQ